MKFKLIICAASAALLCVSAQAQDTETAINGAEAKLTPAIAITPAAQNDVRTRAIPASENTPSGLNVPRYVSLKYGEVNGRSGPSQNHPVAWRYSRRGLPVVIVAETEMWRKVRDKAGDESWMHKRTLDGRRTVIALEDVMIRAKPRDSASAKAVAAKDSLLSLQECDDMGWCKVKADTGHQGYVQHKTIWGAKPL